MSIDATNIRRASRSRDLWGEGLLTAAVAVEYLVGYCTPTILSLMMLNLPNEQPPCDFDLNEEVSIKEVRID